jgi:hypothetical protein
MVTSWISTAELADQTFVTENPLLAQDAVDATSFVLFHLSGRKYSGEHTVTETYCQTGLDQLGRGSYYGPYGRPPLPGPSGYPDLLAYPQLYRGVITNQVGGMCGTCGCTHLLRLRAGPVISVESVRVRGRELDSSAYAVYDYSFIASPYQCWATCDDVEVTYTYGTAPPALGRMAAKAMADQFVLAMQGDEECTLPQRVTSISRQGMSMTLLDPQDFLDKGRTGIYQVDLFLTTINPDGARLRSRVFSPDIPRARARRGDVAPTLFAAPTVMTMSAPTTSTVSSTDHVITDAGRPLRWVVPGSFTQESPPTLVVRPSGEEVPPDALSWRAGNFILDLDGAQMERLLPPGSALVVSTPTGETNYPVERRTS